MAQTQTVEAVYEHGVLRPLTALEGMAEQCKVRITIEPGEISPHPLLRFAGILSDEEAAELRRTTEQEFERVDPDAW